MILQVFFPPFRPGSAHVVGFWPISQWPCDMTCHESEQRERRLPQRRANSSDRSPENRRHGLLLTLFGRRTVLIGDKSIALQPDRWIANPADAQLTGKPPELGLGNDPEHGTEEAPHPASASAGCGSSGLCRASSEAIVAWQGIRPDTIRLAVACQFGQPGIGERWVCHLRSPSRLCAACWKMSRKAYEFEGGIPAFA
jgi:hypothetical protein